MLLLDAIIAIILNLSIIVIAVLIAHQQFLQPTEKKTYQIL